MINFITNKYHRIYFNIINKALEENRSRFDKVYYEGHHILPTALYGSNNITVLLTAKEHFICHWLLTKFTSGDDKRKMQYALKMMATTGGRRSPWSSLEYRIAREAFSEAIKDDKARGEAISKSKKGKIFTEEHKQALAKSQLGKKQSEAQIKKKAESLKKAWEEGRHTGMRGKKTSKLQKQVASNTFKGVALTEEHRQKISKANTGKPGSNIGKKFSEETKLKMSLARKKWHENRTL